MIFTIRTLFVEKSEASVGDTHVSQCEGKITADLV